MNTVIIKIKSLYDDMGRGEKRIADWILDNSSEIIGLSISELADRCGSGEATIVRFARRLGLSGYQDLKISIAQDLSSAKPTVNQTISEDDTSFEVFSKISHDITKSLELTKTVLDRKSMENAAQAIINAGRIIVFGLGNSSSIAIDMQHKLLRAGLDCVAFCDNHMQAIAACHLKKGDVAVGISHSGSSKDVVESLKLAKDSGATTICITNFGKSPILKQSDIALFTASDETKHNIFGMSSRIAQLAIIDALYLFVVINKDKEAKIAIKNTEKALLGKKY